MKQLTTIAMRKTMTASLLVLSTAAMAQPNAATINSGAAALQPKLVEWRRHLHQHPELGNREVQTAAYIAAHLKALGIEVREKWALPAW